MSGANKPAMKRIGYFGEAGYTTIGEPYKTKVVESMPRYKGAQFQTNPQFVGETRRGCNGNGLFGKAPALFNVSLVGEHPLFSTKLAVASEGIGCAMTLQSCKNWQVVDELGFGNG